MKFKRKIESFTCEHCAHFTQGDGFTNHCPKCFWGKHVDVNPGDRLESCGGMMEPVRVEKKADKYCVIHRCTRCGAEKSNRVSQEDDFDVLVKIAENFSKKNFLQF